MICAMEGHAVRKILKNKPLVEAIFELQWELRGKAFSGEKIDPHHRIFVTRLEEEAVKDYPVPKPLPAADVPEKFVPHKVQQQFWTAENEWPVVQVGPGIITLNDTVKYDWEDFKERMSHLLDLFFETHPDSDDLNLNTVMLRYINAIEFDYNNDDVLKFLKEKMKITIDIQPDLFCGRGVSKLPYSFNLQTFFPSMNPEGAVGLVARRGQKNEKDVLFWEIMVQSIGKYVPKTIKEDILVWAENAHSLIRDWFFGIIEGDLLKEFE